MLVEGLYILEQNLRLKCSKYRCILWFVYLPTLYLKKLGREVEQDLKEYMVPIKDLKNQMTVVGWRSDVNWSESLSLHVGMSPP